MTVYEPEDFYEQWDPEWMRFNRKVDKLKALRRKIAHDNEKKIKKVIFRKQLLTPHILTSRYWLNLLP